MYFLSFGIYFACLSYLILAYHLVFFFFWKSFGEKSQALKRILYIPYVNPLSGLEIHFILL